MSFLNLPDATGDAGQREAFLRLQQQRQRDQEHIARNKPKSGKINTSTNNGLGEHGAEVFMGAFLWAIYWAITTLAGKFVEVTGLGKFTNSVSVWLFGSADNVTAESAESIKGILYWLVGELNLFGVKWGAITWWDVLTWEPIVFLVFIPMLIAIFVPEEWFEPKK